MRSHVSWEGERNIVYKSLETDPYLHVFKFFRENSERESSSSTKAIFTIISGDFGLKKKNDVANNFETLWLDSDIMTINVTHMYVCGCGLSSRGRLIGVITGYWLVSSWKRFPTTPT